MSTMELVGLWMLFVFLLAASGLISGSEVAFFSLSPNDLVTIKEEKSRKSNLVIHLLEKNKQLLATILIANNFINISFVVLTDVLLKNILPKETFGRMAGWLVDKISFLHEVDYWIEAIYFAVSVVAVTFLLVLLGEIAPKIYAKSNNIKLSKSMALPLSKLMMLFKPMNSLLINGTRIIEEKLSKRQSSAHLTSKEEIDDAIDLAVRKGKNSNREIGILKGIVKFGELMVKQIMVSRVDTVAIDIDMDYAEVLKIVKDSGFSRLPVFKEDFDHVKGLLYVKELIGYLDKNADFKWQDLVHEKVLFVPETKKIDDLLKEFQSERMHMAIVVDEYGGSLGIITLEDIVEEIIGEIQDEFDVRDEIDFEKINDYKYIFEGKTLINDVCKIINVDTSVFTDISGDSDSIAGLVLEIAGQIPKPGSEFRVDDFSLKVHAANERRIQKVLLTLPKTRK